MSWALRSKETVVIGPIWAAISRDCRKASRSPADISAIVRHCVGAIKFSAAQVLPADGKHLEIAVLFDRPDITRHIIRQFGHGHFGNKLADDGALRRIVIDKYQ